MSNPIPRRLLVHSGTLTPYAGMVNSVKTYGAAVALTFVRFEPVKQNAMTSLGDMKADRFTMFFDCVNSRPAGTVPAVGDKIKFGTIELSARKVTPCYGSTPEVHHYEVACV